MSNFRLASKETWLAAICFSLRRSFLVYTEVNGKMIISVSETVTIPAVKRLLMEKMMAVAQARAEVMMMQTSETKVANQEHERQNLTVKNSNRPLVRDI